MNEKVIDIKYRGTGLERELSNLYPYNFVLDGVSYASMEGFFSCLRTEMEWIKPSLRNTYGYNSWKLGHQYEWKDKQVVYYNGKEISRHSEEYNYLITDAFDALFENLDFKDALTKSKGYKLNHKMGKSSKGPSRILCK